MISSQYSPPLANALVKGTVDADFLRREQGVPGLVFRSLVKEPLVVVLPSDHRLAARKAISPGDLVGETFVGVSHTAPVLRAIIDDYLKSWHTRNGTLAQDSYTGSYEVRTHPMRNVFRRLGGILVA
jgi:DNA-binding transcriptional LysR family regulator